MAMCDYWLSCACDCKVTRKMNASDRPDCKENESDAFIVLLRVHCRSALGVCARSDGSQSLKESTLSVCSLLIGWDVRRMRVISYLFAYGIKSANWKFLDKFKYLYGTDWFQDDQSLPCVPGRYQRESLQVDGVGRVHRTTFEFWSIEAHVRVLEELLCTLEGTTPV
jgi:hypothetical protein